MVKRCKICNLPDNYPYISFNEDGVCNYCMTNKGKYDYPGFEALKRDVDAILSQSDPNRKYDCVVGISGGRDSSYLLYFAKEVLGLNVLAVSIEHDFMTPQAKQNVKTIVGKLGVDIHYIKNEVLNTSGRQCVQNWAKKPDIAMCATFCTGCRYGIKKLIPRFVREQGIPLLLTGDTPFELMDYRVDLLCEGKASNTKNKVIGYGKRLLKNPSYLSSLKTLYYQFQDFVSWEGAKKKSIPVRIQPFFYIEWKKEEVITKIEELGWSYNENFHSTWRSDCYINMLRQFFYKKKLGFNDMDVYYGDLLRNKEIEMPEALQHIEEEGNYSEEAVRSVLKEYYDVDLDDVMRKMNI